VLKPLLLHFVKELEKRRNILVPDNDAPAHWSITDNNVFSISDVVMLL
jgi:hypothetical protein